jgi:ATP:ADP antiporter, AAA family
MIGFVLSRPDIFTSKLIGWFIYCFIESFGSIMPALFLSIVVSTMSTESAKKGYPMIYTFGQLGLVLGQVFIVNNVSRFSFATLFAIGGGLVCVLPLLLHWYFKHVTVTKEEKIEAGEHKPETGMFEGLKLLLSRPYVAGLLIITSAYEIIGTIVEFQMGWCAQIVYPKALDGGTGFAWLKSMNALGIGIFSTLFALVGTGFLMRRFGLKFCITSYPTVIGITLVSIFTFYITGASVYFLMWACFVGALIFKALSYTLNNPAREVLYIPTSKDIKFKAKSWIESFGNRSFKVAGTSVTGTLGASLPPLLIFGTLVSLGVVGFWIFVATFMGNKFNQLHKEGKLVE